MIKNKDRISIERSLMPPPRSVSRSRTNYSLELKKNLIENSLNIHDNNYLKDELAKVLSEKNKEYSSQYEDDINYDIKSQNNEVLKLKIGLENNNILKENNIINNKNLTIKKFNKLPIPKNKIEIKIFVDNLISYISYLNKKKFDCSFLNNIDFHNNFLLLMKVKIETRYNDYKNKGISFDNFINLITSMQDEFINKLLSYNLFNQINSNFYNGNVSNSKSSVNAKYESESDNNTNNKYEDFVDIHLNYDFINKKRKRNRCLSEMKSITSSSSSSYENTTPKNH